MLRQELRRDDSEHRLTSATVPTATGSNTTDYAYDDTDQLTAADHTAQTDENYAYDANGNRTSGGSVVDSGNRIAEDATHTYQYDDNGNLFRETLKSDGSVKIFWWDHRDRLIRVNFRTAANVLTKTVFYDYDVFDRRIARDVDDNGDGVVDRGERFVYDGGDLVLKTDANGNVLNRYLHGPAYDQVFADEDALGEILWALADHQGTVRDWVEHDSTTGTTTVANHLDYDAFGNIVSQSDPSHVPQFGFTGQDWDADVGLYHYSDGTPGGRWYHPRLGRFAKPDDLGFNAGDANLYRYVGNSPGNGTDPSGMEIDFEWQRPGKAYRGPTNATTSQRLAAQGAMFNSLFGNNRKEEIELQIIRDLERLSHECGTSLSSKIADDVLDPYKSRRERLRRLGHRPTRNDLPINFELGARAHAPAERSSRGIHSSSKTGLRLIPNTQTTITHWCPTTNIAITALNLPGSAPLRGMAIPSGCSP